jgi:hypothetical protein
MQVEVGLAIAKSATASRVNSRVAAFAGLREVLEEGRARLCLLAGMQPRTYR